MHALCALTFRDFAKVLRRLVLADACHGLSLQILSAFISTHEGSVWAG